MDDVLFHQITSIPIRSVIKHLTGVEDSGVKIKCIFPQHDDPNPSMKIWDGENSFYCYGCGRGGSIINMVAEFKFGDKSKSDRKRMALHYIAKQFLNMNLVDDSKFSLDRILHNDRSCSVVNKSILKSMSKMSLLYHRVKGELSTKAEAVLDADFTFLCCFYDAVIEEGFPSEVYFKYVDRFNRKYR